MARLQARLAWVLERAPRASDEGRQSAGAREEFGQGAARRRNLRPGELRVQLRFERAFCLALERRPGLAFGLEARIERALPLADWLAAQIEQAVHSGAPLGNALPHAGPALELKVRLDAALPREALIALGFRLVARAE